MVLTKLIMQAFGPFAGKEEVDFQRLNHDSQIFLISGATGSGKTTIFDAICFALYGKVSGRRKEPKTLKSSFASEKTVSYVELSFISNEKTYRIIRYPQQERKNRRLETIVTSQKAELILPDNRRIDKIKQVDEEIEKILGIEEEDFEKLVMLPQGQFQKLLLEKGKDRVKTLRQIFRTQLYGDITELLCKKAREMESGYEALENQCRRVFADVAIEGVCFDELSIEEGYDLLQKHCKIKEEELKRKSERLNQWQEQIQSCRETIAQAKKQKEQLLLLHKNEAEMERLRAKKEEIRQLEQDVRQMRVIQSVYSMYRLCEDAKKQLHNLQHRLEQTEKAYAKAKETEEKYQAKAKEMADMREEIQVLQKQAAVLLGKEEKAKKKEELQKKYVSAEKRVHLLEEQKQLQKWEEELLSLQSRIKLKQEMEAASKEMAEVERRLKKAQQDYLEGCRMYFETQAASLAGQLQEGKPCPVCGSIHHPKKAVSQSAIEQEEVHRLLQQKDALAQHFQKLKYEQEKRTDLDDPHQTLAELIRQKEAVQKKKASIKEQTGDIPAGNLEALWEETFLEREKLKAALCEYREEDLDWKGYKAKREESERQIQNLLTRMEEIENQYEKSRKEADDWREQKASVSAKAAQVKEQILQYEKSLNQALDKEHISRLALEGCEEKMQRLKEKENALEEYHAKVKQTSALIQVLRSQTADHPMPDIETLSQEQSHLLQEGEKLQTEMKGLTEKLAVFRVCRKNVGDHLMKMKQGAENFGVVKRLSKVARGSLHSMSFEKYVLASYFDEVISYANLRAERMHHFHYQLIRLQNEEDDGISLGVLDTYSGDIRPVNTLSGGETFVASLSLSLGLADVISNQAGGVWFGTMLIDEGFGSLDDEYLDSVVDCLSQLQNSHRQIGMISHVKQLKERISNVVLVKRQGAFEGSKICMPGMEEKKSVGKRLPASGFFAYQESEQERNGAEEKVAARGHQEG